MGKPTTEAKVEIVSRLVAKVFYFAVSMWLASSMWGWKGAAFCWCVMGAM